MNWRDHAPHRDAPQRDEPPEAPTVAGLVIELAMVEDRLRRGRPAAGEPGAGQRDAALLDAREQIVHALAQRGLQFPVGAAHGSGQTAVVADPTARVAAPPDARDPADPAATVLIQTLSAQVRDLETALAGRTAIAQAVGILMERFGLSDGEAFDRLRVASNHSNRKLREIAGDVTVAQRESTRSGALGLRGAAPARAMPRPPPPQSDVYGRGDGSPQGRGGG